MNPLLLFRTLQHLRWQQIAYRPLRVVQFKLYRSWPQLAFRPIEAGSAACSVSRKTLETVRGVFNEQFPHLNQPLGEFDLWLNGLKQNRFTFLNRSLTIDSPDWNRRYENHLWNYQLHYFGFAPFAARALIERGDVSAWQACRRLIESWIVEASVGRSDGWDAYPISLRAVNWIYAYALVSEFESEEFLSRWRASIFDQFNFLSRHLEYHLLANHLLKNIKALVIGGLFFQNESWLTTGERLLWRELDEQILADGGHYERSPMYHAQSLVDFLEAYAFLLAFGRIERSEMIEARLRAMAGFLSAMSYSDGTLALFNDSANTIETRPQTILETANRVVGTSPRKAASGNRTFSQSGYFIWSSANEQDKIIVDCGSPSVAYNTAHAHCDLLSYELWLDGQPFIVDSGVHGYGGDRFREYSRSARAHNTVMFDGIEQSEIWGTFRMARAAGLIDAESGGDEHSWKFRGSFERFDRRLIHERRICRESNGDWLITDYARRGGVALASSFIHLHPSVEANKINSTEVLCQIGERRIVIAPFADEGVSISTRLIKGSQEPIQGWRFPDFGISQPSVTIQFDYQIKCGDAFGYSVRQSLNK